MARPRKPHNLHVIDGTDQKSRRKDAVVELPLVDAVPVAPDWLPNAHAVKEWDRLAPILQANGLLTTAGTSALGQLCALHGKVVQLYSAGESPHASMVAQLRGLLNDFGLTPAAQGKVKSSAEGEKANKFARNGRRT